MKPHENRLIAGVDEAGRGPLAGPVITAAVILNPDKPIPGLRDSKKLSDQTRRYLNAIIRTHAYAYALGRAEVSEIDTLNIHHATLLAMQRAIEALPCRPHLVLIDGLFCPKISIDCEALVRGDLWCPPISAASILAKVARDDEMIALDNAYPGYDFAQHKGYPTKKHITALHTMGVSQQHRRSYAPVKQVLAEGLQNG